MAAPLPGRCGFYLEKKNRFCKMVVGKGKVFCGEHANMEEGNSRRIVCPLDPKHTVSEDRLEKHLKKCNNRLKPRPVYFVEDRNAGSAEEDEEQVCLSQRSRAELQSLILKLQTAVEGLQTELQDSVLSHEVLQEELNNPKNGESATKHLKQQSSLLGNLQQLQLLSGSRCFVEFGAGKGKLSHWIRQAVRTRSDCRFLLVERSSTRFKVDGKHQDAEARFERLQVDIQHLDLSRVPLLRQNRIPVVGVGKHLCGAATDLALRCLFERRETGQEAEPPCKRPRPGPAEPGPADPEPGAELRPADPEPEPRPADPEPGAADPDAGPAPGPEVCGLAVALCCHHRCAWRHYVGKDFFLQKGLGAAEFAAFCRMSSWATCGLRPANRDAPPQDPAGRDLEPQDPADRDLEPQDPADRDLEPQDPAGRTGDGEEHEPAEETEPDTFSGLVPAERRQLIGRLCKLLIDGGRLDFLRRKGFTARLRRYAGPQVTLENVLLTAVPSDTHTHTHTHTHTLTEEL